jgi:putative hydrolase of the HAD superfamily
VALRGVIRAVLLDALGTLVELEPPGPRLRRALSERAGVDVGAAVADSAFAAEIEHYLAHHLEGGDDAGLERLRDDCAAVMHAALGLDDLDRSTVRAAMLDSLRFTAFADAAPALRELRVRGLRLVVASNWDRSLADRLAETGLGELLDGAVSSAEAGAAKPDQAPLLVALELAGAEPGEAVHVGDSAVNDVGAARAAGVRPILLVRERGAHAAPPGVATVTSLAEVASLL